jgi:hypothetical protein
MKSDSLVTLLLSILAISLGIINARKKKKQAMAKPRQIFFDPESIEEEDVFQEPVSEPTREPEPEPIEVQSVQEIPSKKSSKKLKEMGFDAKKAVLFSEILKQKF